MSDDTTIIQTELLKGLFDLAVNSMDFGSGFWDDEDVAIGRAVAVLIGIDPINGTPRTYAERYEHTYDREEHWRKDGTHYCGFCMKQEEADIHV